MKHAVHLTRRTGSFQVCCGIWTYWPEDRSWKPEEVTCGNCKRTKRYKQATS